MIYGKLPIVFLGLLASEKAGTTNSVIANYILDNLDSIKTMGIQELSQNCNVSISSISSFCREIGLDNFSELKFMLEESNLHKGPQSKEGDFSDRLEYYSKETISGIEKVKSSISEESIIELVKDIYQYEKVAAFGLMKASTSALILQSDLLMYGKKLYSNISFKEQIDYINHADEDHLIILFSFTKSYFDYISYETFEYKKKWPKIWIIGSGDDKLPNYVYKSISFDSLRTHFEHPNQLSFVATLLAQEYNRFISEKEI